ncbi:hypothetical protein MNBD_GAMMA13-1729 [hydrothermal vent metagenome]|uniref:NAD-dependent epimerase/dehydratase domain-containing protein n=1 Tax=hydrothermal vent metagenome TaxID=652676 RepID=A0A3B0ZN01_9ZZZZ
MKTVLVTGATGFLGSHVLEALMSNKDIHLIAACRKPAKLLPGFKGDVRQGDLTDRTYIKQLTQDVDVICHAAAWTSLWAHREEEQRYYREPTLALIDAAIAARVQRFIFDSSVVVAGPHRDGTPLADHEPAKHPRFWPHMDIVVDIENHMRKQADRGTTMVSLRCGHLVPWVASGKACVPLVDGRDLSVAYALAATADGLNGFESFNICGPSFPPMHEVIGFLHTETGVSRPHFGVPLIGAYMFGWLMEKLNPVLPGDPFLTRSIVFLGEDWYAPSDLARERLGYEPKFDWKTAIRTQLREMESQGYPRTSFVDGTRWWAR